MSEMANGPKPPQAGLVDMGDIDFYNDPSDPIPPFTITDLEDSSGIATFGTSFSEIVLNVTWAQLQPTEGGAIDDSAIENAISLVNAYNSLNNADLGIKLRVWRGYTAPDWAKAIDGPPVTVTGPGTVDPNSDQTETIGRFWSADYIAAWTAFQNQLAAEYDNKPLIRGISNTAGAAATDEPFVPLHPDQVAELVSGGYTDAAEQTVLRAAVSDYTGWTTTPLDYTMNLFHLEDNGKVTPDPDFTLAVLQSAVSSSRLVQAGNHALNNPQLSDTFVYAQMTAYAALYPATPPGSFQTASPVNLKTIDNWNSAVANGVTAHAGDIELWDGPKLTGFTGQPPGTIAALATTLAAGIPPAPPAPDNGTLLGFIAPASVIGGAGSVALTGTGAVLLASASSATTYTVTVNSTGGHTLQVTNFATLAGGIGSGTTLSFSGSLDQVNTTLASLTDALPLGTDILRFAASDNASDTAVRSVGVVVSAGSGTGPGLTGPITPAASGSATTFTWTGAGNTPLFTSPANWTPGGGPPGASDSALFSASPSLVTVSGTGTVDALIVDTTLVPGGGSTLSVGQGGVVIADQPDSVGSLLLGGVNTSLTVAGDLAIGGTGTAAGGFGALLAALAPDAYSTASLSIGGTLLVGEHGIARIAGAVAAAAINVANGGTISGDGTLTATGTAVIANGGVIEAVADQTLGLQQLTLAGPISGTGQLVVDPSATLILAGSVAAQQTIDFAPNTAAQFANTPYSPSTLVLAQPLVTQGSVSSLNFFGTITGFTFADSLVLDGISASVSAYSNGTLTVTTTGTQSASYGFALSGALDNMVAVASVTGTGTAAATTITFVAPGLGQLPSVTAPAVLQAVTGVAVVVPDIVLQTPLPAVPDNNTTVLVTVTAANGTFAADNDNNNTTISELNSSQTLILAGSLGAVARSLQSLTYQSGVAGTDSISLTVSDYDGMSAQTTIAVNSGTAASSFIWATPTSGSFSDAADWHKSGTVAGSPPGGADFAVFNSGHGPSNKPYTVSGNGAVGRIVVADTVTFTGQILAQGEGTQSIIVDGSAGAGGALTLAGGAALTASQAAVVGNTGDGILTLMGGALNLTNTNTTTAALTIGSSADSNGTVLDYEQITALGSVVVGSGGDGALRLLGVASTVSDGGADIGQLATAHGVAVVDGGFWTNAGQLTVGDAGAGSLLIGGAANGITGQATALDATIGAQGSGVGTVTVDDGNFLVADAVGTTSSLVVGDAGAGTLSIDGGNVTVGAPLVNGTIVTYNGALSVGGTATGSGLVSIDKDGALLVEGNGTVGVGGVGRVDVGQGTTDDATLALTGSLSIGAFGQIVLGDSEATLRAGAITVAVGGALTGAGTVSGDGGGNDTVLLTSIDNSGTIMASGGNLLVYGGVSGNGLLTTDTNATITLQAAVGAGQVLSFASGAHAVLDDAMAFAGTVTGFAVGNELDLASTDATGAIWSSGTLSVLTNTGSIVLHVAGSYAANAFSVQSDGLGGTDITLACFAGGTRIQTPDGPVAVETLAVGDSVLTLSGQMQTIHWLGRRHVDCCRHPRPDAVWPVRIKAGAFSANCPTRDLFLSPDHAVYVDGVLIPVKHLLNGTTLRQMRVAAVTYYHVELAAHDVILAEGLPAESFLDTGNRGAFVNAPGAVQLHPDFGPADNLLRWDALGYAPLCVTGPVVDAARARLQRRGFVRGRQADDTPVFANRSAPCPTAPSTRSAATMPN